MSETLTKAPAYIRNEGDWLVARYKYAPANGSGADELRIIQDKQGVVTLQLDSGDFSRFDGDTTFSTTDDVFTFIDKNIGWSFAEETKQGWQMLVAPIFQRPVTST